MSLTKEMFMANLRSRACEATERETEDNEEATQKGRKAQNAKRGKKQKETIEREIEPESPPVLQRTQSTFLENTNFFF
jgi:hypothetical protein